MTDEEIARVQDVKEKAAAAAFEVYAAHLLHALDSMGLDFQALHDTIHSHSALLQDKRTGQWLAASCRWEFSTSPEVIAREIQNATHEAAVAEARAAGL
jgi:hypothetical protein